MWYRKVTEDLGNIALMIQFYENELEQSGFDVILKGSVEKAAQELSGITANRFNQLQELESVLKYLNTKLDKIRSDHYKKYLERYNRELSDRAIEKYIDGENDVIDMANLINEVALIRNKYLGIIKSLDTKNWMIGHIVRLRTAGLEDVSF